MAAYTGFPEMMDGRIKTLHPKIHGGILCRRDRPDDMAAIAAQGIVPFELVVVNLYPFQRNGRHATDVTVDEAIENIDIGGPTLIRGAAKNHAVRDGRLRSTDQYPADSRTDTRNAERQRSRIAASLCDRRVSAYRACTMPRLQVTSADLSSCRSARLQADSASAFPAKLNVELTLAQITSLRRESAPTGGALHVARMRRRTRSCVRKQLHGKELSYNNLLDLDSALAAVRLLPIAERRGAEAQQSVRRRDCEHAGEAIRRAWEGDPLSAFGSVLGFNVPVDAAAAEFLVRTGSFRRSNRRARIHAGGIRDSHDEAKVESQRSAAWPSAKLSPVAASREFRQISGGMLCQTADDLPDDEAEWKVVTEHATERSATHPTCVSPGPCAAS